MKRAEDRGEPKSRTNSIVELIVIVLVAIGLALAIQAFIVKPYRIPSGSMEPTLKVGQRVLVNRIDMHFREPHMGEIVVFHPPKDAEQQVCGRSLTWSPPVARLARRLSPKRPA